MEFNDFFIPQFFLASFPPSPKLPRHTCWPSASHHCVVACQLKFAALEASKMVKRFLSLDELRLIQAILTYLIPKLPQNSGFTNSYSVKHIFIYLASF
jgi:hypothetical protein